jgi:tRNA 2-thiouridine synthesizing protein E
VDNAREHGPWPLSSEHWAVAQFVLAYHKDNGDAPALVRVARATGLSSRALYALFPYGVVRTIVQLAGLPMPAELLGCCPLPSRGASPPASD